MRLLVINTVLDPSTTALRARHPGKVHQRPVIAGQALPQRGRRVLPVDLLSKAVVAELERLVSIGNIKVVELGGRFAVNFTELRIRLGHIKAEMATLEPTPAPVAESPEAPQVEAAPEPASLFIAGTLPPQFIPGQETAPTTALEEVPGVFVLEPIEKYLDPVGEPSTEIPSVETFTPPSDIDGLIRNSKNRVLVTVLAMFDKSGTGKNKLRLVAEASECFMGDLDTVVANRALTYLRDHQE